MAKVKPIKAIRRFCVACQGGSSGMVRGCEDASCILYPFRNGEEPEDAERSCVQTIRRHCFECSGGERAEIRRCAAREDCALWSFRFGCSPETWHRVRNRKKGAKALLLPGITLSGG
ncbi:restriction endonuclease [Oleidesulfovibrio sp.]|uniref:restriction endonuclease n=1 Tax=Oleidesulfovibrio sp. TaxID=2909707 RepID=UPI003A87FF6F